MLKSILTLMTIGIILALGTVPALAMLRVLEPAVSDELKVIAREHLIKQYNLKTEDIIIEDSWLREFFNAKVDVYMIETVIDKGLPGERKVQVAVRVDQKAVLNEADLTKLDEEDKAIGSSNPEIRVMTAQDSISTTEKSAANNNTLYYILAAVGAVVVLTSGLFIYLKTRKN